MLTGSCLCGGIRYKIKSELGDIMQCHCQNCRKANGAAFAVNAGIPKNAFSLLKGQELVSEYESTPGVFRAFCQRCASPLYSRRPSMPDILRLRIGTLDTKIDKTPSFHIFVDSKAEWHNICDDTPQHKEFPTS
ncbi:GFA family protein [Marinomonas sp. 5E14-1]|uniref:GFA family protein n=1 Tax=Marinomonas sp. 5E14-1 TaxID=3153922 RepID=UPI0032651D42